MGAKLGDIMKFRLKLNNMAIALAVLMFAGVAPISGANAGTVIGGSSMLTGGYLTILESWLGEGELALTNIFTKDATDTTKDDSTDWHTAVDDKGRTFSLWEVETSNGQGGVDSFIMGGYNPQSWYSSGGFNKTPLDVDRTAFIFNLSTGVKLDQCTASGNILCGNDLDDEGKKQTYNHSGSGPTFGSGYDLFVSSDLLSGYNRGWSYGILTGEPGWGSSSLLDNDNDQPNWLSVGALETFTITPVSSIPLPAALPLYGAGLAVMGFIGWRRRRKAAATV